MSKSSKKRERDAKIARRKAMKKAHMEQQDNYRLKKHNKKKKRHMTSHPYGHCGNIGCKRCNPPKYVSQHRHHPLTGAPIALNDFDKRTLGKERYLERMKRNRK